MGWFDNGELIKVRLDVDELTARLERMGANSKALPMETFGALLVAEVDDMFQTQGAAGTDGPWEPFSPNTLRIHPRRIGGMLLQDTGAMANIQVKEITEQTVTVVSPVGYARWHIEGTEYMPKRDFFALNFPEVLDRFSEIALEELVR